MKVEESLNVTFDESPPPTKLSSLVDDDVGEEEAIENNNKVVNNNNIEDESVEVDNVVAMQEELNQFIANDVWDLVPLPKNQSVIGTKWVYRNKLDENGIVSGNKARLVSQGYNQQEGIDYDETYAPVARLESIRILLAVAYGNDFKLYQIDVKSAFLNINEEIFFNQSKYIKEMLKKFELEDSKPTKTPMSTEIKLTMNDEDDSVDSTKYQETRRPYNLAYFIVMRMYYFRDRFDKAKQPRKPPQKRTRNVRKSRLAQLPTSSSFESPLSDNEDLPSIKLSPMSDNRALLIRDNMSKDQTKIRGIFKNLARAMHKFARQLRKGCR
uniref:Copia protein n=1 Tax=Tanacetum cinerariifolium TaxID=118510 RepID=A0A6L2N7T7_TANCI|nr:copia protein [Tanacetum cinerariifolium]